MLKILAVAIFLAVILPVHGQEKGTHSGDNQGNSKSAHDQSPPPTNHADCVIKQDGTTIECEWPKTIPESKLQRLFSPENAPNIALFIVGLAGVFAAVCTLRAIEKQADIAANSQRSWIIPKGVSKPDLSGVWVLKASCEFEVFGLSPVRVFESKFRFHFVAAKPSDRTGQAIPDLPDIPVYGAPATLSDSPEMGRVWPPGAIIPVGPMLEQMIAKPEELQSHKDGESVLCLYGYIRYRDAFDKSKMRETRFCFTCGKMGPFEAKMEEHFVLGGPPAYNEID